MRRKTRTVWVGNVGVGGDNSIRIQSMTTSPTHDVDATVAQIIKLADHGCEIARVTVQGMREAKACEAIKNQLIQKNYTIPLVADIHFYPPAALTVADFVDKVRINPGNFADKRAIFKTAAYTEADHLRAIEKIEEAFAPLLEKCKRLKKPLRIGTNHGSLSDRIMSAHGNTPRGMVVSALEFTHIARKYDFHDLIFSMKASNPLVMIEAYRLLVAEMDLLGLDYPLHLGVTEAGAGEDGRIKSAVGMGALLQDGIGDTIRVSLTEDPWCEIEPAKKLASLPLSTPAPIPQRTSNLALVASDIPTPNADLILSESDNKHILFAPKTDRVHATRTLFASLKEQGLPVILDFSYPDTDVITPAAEIGALLADNLGDGILIRSPAPAEERVHLAFAILQACRKRLTKTEFISCPGCGRTLFDLQEVSKQIRARTAHLPGVKIAVMGCIVNGPGEMADADFGYVGAAKGKIDLYIGKTCVEKGVDATLAPDRLISLIQSQGKWIEKPQI